MRHLRVFALYPSARITKQSLHQRLFALVLACFFLTQLAAAGSVSGELFHNLQQEAVLCRLLYLPLPVTEQSSSTLAKGKFLVASRELSDPNFSESVILLLDYNHNGAVGVIINRPTEVPLATLLPEIKVLQKRKDMAYLGGPVARHMLMLLARAAHPPHDAQLVFSDTYLVPQKEDLEHLVPSNAGKTTLRAYVGYAGWTAGQLDMEVARGGWHIVPADAAFVFDKAATDVWPELIRRGEAQWVKRYLFAPSPIFALTFR